MKRMKVGLVAAVVMVALVGSVGFGLAWAEQYDGKARVAVGETLQKFFNEENGNRLTSYSMRALMGDINQAFMSNMAVEGPEVGGQRLEDGKKKGIEAGKKSGVWGRRGSLLVSKSLSLSVSQSLSRKRRRTWTGRV